VPLAPTLVKICLLLVGKLIKIGHVCVSVVFVLQGLKANDRDDEVEIDESLHVFSFDSLFWKYKEIVKIIVE